jgi:hypothetical protein
LLRAVARIKTRTDVHTIRALGHRNVFLIQSSAPSILLPIQSDEIPESREIESGTTQCIIQNIPGDPDWPGMTFAVALHLGPTYKTVAIVTSLESNDPQNRAVELAENAAETVKSDIAEHERMWKRFWAASGIDLQDELLTDTWYRNLYFLRCVSKKGVVAPGLFAGLINDQPAWHGDYHTNYNIQQTFWTAYVTNHPDLAEPYDRLVLEYLPRARWLADQVFSLSGAYYPHTMIAYEPPNPERCKSPNGRQRIHHVWGFTLGVAGFTVQPLWWHYKYDPSRELLESVYPVIRDVALFYADFIEQCPGDSVVRLGPSVSPEHWGWTRHFERNWNCAFDIAMVRHTLNAAIECSRILQVDIDHLKRWMKVLAMLPPYPTSDPGNPIVVDVKGAPPINYNIAVPATPVFPANMISWWSSPEKKALFKWTIDSLQWNGNNSTIMLAVARARLSMKNTHDWLQTELQHRLRSNGTLALNRIGKSRFNDFGHYTEQFAASMAISELLIQSVDDIIRLFPAWPLEKQARFTKLRAQGGFLVSSECSKGKISYIKVVSTAGGTMSLLNPWDKARVFKNNRPTDFILNNLGILQITTTPEDVIDILPGMDKS